MCIQVMPLLDLTHQDERSISKHEPLLIIAILLSITTLLTIGPKVSNFCKLQIPRMIPLNLLHCLENPFADMTLQRPHYSWEVTRRFNYAEGLVKCITREVEHVNAINPRHTLLFLERAGSAMNDIRALKDRCMARTLTYSEGYKKMGVLIKELREVEVEVRMYAGEPEGLNIEVLEIPPEGEEGCRENSGEEGLPAPRLTPPPPPILQRPGGAPVGTRARKSDGAASMRGLSRYNAIVRRRRPFPRALSEERRRSAYVTTILSPRPDRTGLLAARNPLLDDADG
ncbi:hypothetical protein HOY80DRAFT_1002754 [Tuber brumale]|nr:hypothetical protein HOY80DRAFT_1002754 [Tuber brumale]